jgi:hypothetical protein
VISRIKLKARVAALGGCLLIAACGVSDLAMLQDPIVLNCPDYRILEDAATLTKFRDGPGRDLTDIEYRAEMGAIRLGCLSDIDPTTNSGVMEIDISPIMQMELGPANENPNTSIPYFIVITDPNKEILYRSEERVDISFAANRTQLVVAAPPITLELPITPTIRNDHYAVYGGFALTEAQTQFNRRSIQRRTGR